MISKILNNIFSSRSGISILRSLFNYTTGITGREISRLTGYSPKACHETLTSLEKFNIIKRIRGGRDHLFSLNRDHYLYKNILSSSFEVENNYLNTIKDDLKKNLKNYCISAYIFGSIARGEDTPESDFDICLVYENSNQRKHLENEIYEVKKYFFDKYGIIISPLYFSLNEFNRRRKTSKSPVPEILKDGIKIFHNQKT